jgi:hypothetical protein
VVATTSTGSTQGCSTPGCGLDAASTTRSAPAYCLRCVDAAYRTGGLEPLEPFVTRKARRRTRCLDCAVELTYPLGYVLEKNGYAEPVCRVCHWARWGAQQRGTFKSELDTALGVVLSHPERLSASDREALAHQLAEIERLRTSMQRWWWPTERTRATVDLLHHDLVLDTAELVGTHNDGMDPVVVRCRLCGFESVQLPGRMDSELAGRWCMCPSCNARNKGSCASDVAVGFAARGLLITDPRQGTDTVQDADCARCGTPRRVSMRKLNRGLVPCFVCDGAADPSTPHRVYLFHFPAWGVYKIGITNSGNDARLQTHRDRGGDLVEVVTVPHRAAALWVEVEVLGLVTAWPATGLPAQQRLDGWTEMWDAAAPVTVRLADFVERAQGIEMDPALVLDWKANREPSFSATPLSRLVLRPGDRVCFTGAGAGLTRTDWQRRARAAGLHQVGDVSAAVAVLVTSDPDKVTAKLRRAVELGVEVATYDDFADALTGEGTTAQASPWPGG